jgi:hypothetical protein
MRAQDRVQTAGREAQKARPKGRYLLPVLAFLAVLFLPVPARAENYGIWAAGGDPIMGPQMEAWAREFAKLIGDRGVTNMDSAKSEAELLAAIKKLKGKVKCGDSIVFYYNGHGSESGGNLEFRRGGSRGSVSASELVSWFLDSAGLRSLCTCKVIIVDHSCYSGNFIDNVTNADPHVIIAQSSTGGTTANGDGVIDERSRTVTWGGRDWPSKFNEDLAKVAKGLNLQDAMQEAGKSADSERSDAIKKTDKPQTWKRFSGHVEAVEQPKPNGPKTVTLKDRTGALRKIVMNPGSRIKVGKKELDFCLLNVCSDATILVQKKDTTYTAKSSTVSLNVEGAWGHVQSVDLEKGLVVIHFGGPDFMKESTYTFKWIPPDSLPDWLKECKWVMITEGHLDTVPSIGGVKEIESPEVEFYGHVQSADPAKGEFAMHITRPRWQYCHTRRVKMKEGVKLPPGIEYCKWVRVKGRLSDSIYDATGVTIDRSPQPLSFRGHVREVKDGVVTIHIQDPEWLFCQVRKFKLPRNGKLPDFVKPCNTIHLRGDLTPDSIKPCTLGSLGWVSRSEPVKINLKGHIEAAGDGWIDVLVAEPPALKGKTVRVRPAGGKVPEGFTPCHDITFTGNMVYDSIINAANLAMVGQPQKTADAGVKHALAPRLEIPGYMPVVPEAVVENSGGDSIHTMTVICRVDSLGTQVYADTRSVTGLAPGGTADVAFNTWTPGAPGNSYEASFQTQLEGDDNPANDRLTQPVFTGAAENRAPVLDSGQVRPDSGQAGIPFAYRVLYRDADGDAPAKHEVLVDGVPQAMTPSGGDPVSGMWFVFQTALAAGEHWYLFQFEDGHGHAVKTLTQAGPSVR